MTDMCSWPRHPPPLYIRRPSAFAALACRLPPKRHPAPLASHQSEATSLQAPPTGVFEVPHGV